MSNITSAPFNWREHLKVHPAADLFPLMSETDPQALKELAEDIRKNGGLQEPIKLWRRWDENGRTDEVVLLDGRNRADALALLGWLSTNDNGELVLLGWLKDDDSDLIWDWPLFDEDIDQGTDEDAAARVISLNVHRRHLTPAQKRDLIAELLKANPEQSNRAIAKQVKQDHHKVAKVRAELEDVGKPHVETHTDTKGRKQPSKKSTENNGKQRDQIIWEGFDEGKRQAQMAKELGISQSTVQRILAKPRTVLDRKARKQPSSKPERKLTASEIEYQNEVKRRLLKLHDDWLADHPGKTIADAEIAGSCSNSPEGEATWHEWYDQRYKDRDPLDCDSADNDDAIVRRIKAQREEIIRAMQELLESIKTCDDMEFLAFLAKDTTLIELCVESQMRAKRELGKLLNEQDASSKKKKEAA